MVFLKLSTFIFAKSYYTIKLLKMDKKEKKLGFNLAYLSELYLIRNRGKTPYPV